ncbi:hypothetical protein [Kitasatospora sp. NPDC059571]|uniref:hypothetical protein n=1 Tax=Kitasatospora sp. NPDC059571 TaxID=3346871 RepID=UPI003678804B
MIEKLNQAVRRPEAHGGVPVLPLLLDLLAEAGQQTADALWIPDANERLSAAPFVRDHFTDPAIHVTASQYGEDAYRRGWLHLDRTLSAADHAALLDRAAAWANTDRTLHEVLDEFGPASVTFGNPAPHLPKTLSYATSDPGAPFVAFHFAAAPGESAAAPEPVKSAGAALLAVRGVPGALFGLKLTPRGRAACWPL